MLAMATFIAPQETRIAVIRPRNDRARIAGISIATRPKSASSLGLRPKVKYFLDFGTFFAFEQNRFRPRLEKTPWRG